MFKKGMKKGFAYVLVFCLLFSSAGITAFAGDDAKQLQAEKQIGDNPYYTLVDGQLPENAVGTESSAVTTEGGFVSIEKNISPTGMENEFIINLEVTTKEKLDEIKVAPDAAVLLLLDASNSMQDTVAGGDANDNSGNPERHSRMKIARNAANQFVNDYASGAAADVKRLVSIVQFGTNAMRALDWKDAAKSNEKIEITNVISGIQPRFWYEKYKDFFGRWQDRYDDGGTNIEGALQLADNILKASKDKELKDIKNLYVILLTDGEPTACINGNANSTTLIYGKDGTAVHRSDYEDVPGIANSIKTKATLFTISFTKSGDRVKVDGLSRVEWLKQKVASDRQNFDAASGESLVISFGSIVEIMKKLAEAWLVTDPMGDCMIFDESFTADPEKKINITTTESTEIRYFNKSTKTLYWDLKRDLQYKTLKEQGGATNYIYTLSYKVILDTAVSGFDPAKLYPTNKQTTLTYMLKNKEGNYVNEDIRKVDFKVPAVKGYLGDFGFWKKEENTGKKLANANFALKKGTEQFKTAVSSPGNGDGTLHGKVSFAGIPYGSYTISEIVPDSGVLDLTLPDGSSKKYTPNTDTITFDVNYGVVSNVKGLTALNDEGSYFNTPDPCNTDIQITKAWNAPTGVSTGEEITVDVYKHIGTATEDPEGTKIDTVTVKASDNWQFISEKKYPTVEFVPAQGGQTGEYKAVWYTVKEVAIDGKAMDENGYTADGFKHVSTTRNSATSSAIVNAVTSKTAITVTKAWIAPEDKIPAGGVTVQLQKLVGSKWENVGASVSLTKAPYTYKFSNLDRWDDNAQVIQYQVIEKDVPSGFTGSGAATEENKWTIANTINQEYTSVSGIKLWQDGGENVEHTAISVELMKNGNKTGQTVKLSDQDGWKYSFKNLEVYDLENGGARNVYTVSEIGVPEGYTQKKAGQDVINTRAEKIDIPVEKVWDVPEKDEAGDKWSYYPEVTFYLMQTLGAKTQTYAAIGTGEPYTIVLEAGGEKRKGTFKDIPKFDENGNRYTYNVAEVIDGTGFSSLAEKGKDGYSFTVTNRYSELTNINGQKIWVDGDNAQKKRPSQIIMKLYRGTEDTGREVVAKESSGWAFSFKNVPKYDGKGLITDYNVIEAQLPGYDKPEYKVTMVQSQAAIYTVTNTLSQETITISGAKIWATNEDDLGLRATGVKVELLIPDASEVDGYKLANVPNNPQTIAADDTYSFTAPRFDEERNVISYQVREIRPDGYTVRHGENIIDDKGNITVQITNEYNQKYVNLPAQKVWVDQDNIDKKRTAVTLDLHRVCSDGSNEVVASVELTEKDALKENKNIWRVDKFVNAESNLGWPVYGNLTGEGTCVQYSYYVDEDEVPAGYTKDTTSSDAGIIGNYLVNASDINIEVSKQWVAPEGTEIKIELYRTTDLAVAEAYKTDGLQPVGEQTLKPEQYDSLLWKYTFKGLEKYQVTGSGEGMQYAPYYYFAVEKGVKGSFESARDEGNPKFSFINTIKQEKIDVQGQKHWETTAQVTLPDFVEIELLQDGAPIATAAAMKSNEYRFEFTGLDKYALGKNENGHAHEYTVREKNTDQYNKVKIGEYAFDVAVDGFHIYNRFDDPDGFSKRLVCIYQTLNTKTGAITEDGRTNSGKLSAAEMEVYMPSPAGYTRFEGKDYTHVGSNPDSGSVTVQYSGVDYTVTLTYQKNYTPEDPIIPNDPGRDPKPPRVPETPTNPGTEIPDPNVPLIDLPAVPKPDVVIPEPEAPLSDIPQTGADQDMAFNLALLGISLTALLTVLFGRKRKDAK